MPSAAFLKSRTIGEVAQDWVKEMLESWHLAVAPTPRGYHPGYDGFASGVLHDQPVRFTYEVKWDKKSSQTSNIYLDIESLRKSKASILLICLNDPIDTVLMLPLQQALEYAQTHQNGSGGEFSEPSCICPIQEFISALKPKVLTTKT